MRQTKVKMRKTITLVKVREMETKKIQTRKKVRRKMTKREIERPTKKVKMAMER